MNTRQKALVLGGKTGLVGQAIAEVLRNSGWEVTGIGRNEVDFREPRAADALAALIDKIEPACVFNAIAYTDVDKAEEDVENATLLNRTLPAMLARLLKTRPCQFIHYSTDFVFNGKKQTPYATDDTTDPLSIYGKTKLSGEEAILALDLPHYLIIRSAWLFGPGRRQFISAILDLARTHREISVIHDQVGSPTYTLDLAMYSLKLLESGVSGLFHVVNSGQASKCELADEAIDLAQLECVINPISSAEYAQKALRPAYSVLDYSALTRVTGITPRPWPQALREYIFMQTASEPQQTPT